ncbi:hypothetical protein KI688_007225 [Linnemannia hyalina]|uniref:Uncharacterized protein n=1 Tax=Linnemannia hyalina TaxID=64524 RepID=A0A9P8BMF8_9FUNG|nr:hypothetical protein KI688_007225 [Linnemannia hyalina]
MKQVAVQLRTVSCGPLNCKNPKTMISPPYLLYSILNTIQKGPQGYLVDGD